MTFSLDSDTLRLFDPTTAAAYSWGVTTNLPRPLEPGDPAPDFTLPTVPDEGFVSLADYRGRSSLLLVLLRTVGR